MFVTTEIKKEIDITRHALGILEEMGPFSKEEVMVLMDRRIKALSFTGGNTNE